jgi:hypothetical protein
MVTIGSRGRVSVGLTMPFCPNEIDVKHNSITKLKKEILMIFMKKEFVK